MKYFLEMMILMVRKLKDASYVLYSTPKEIFEVFIFKIVRYRKYSAKVNWLARTITFPTNDEACRCYEEMKDAEGVSLSLHGRKIKAYIPRPLIELVD